MSKYVIEVNFAFNLYLEDGSVMKEEAVSLRETADKIREAIERYNLYGADIGKAFEVYATPRTRIVFGDNDSPSVEFWINDFLKSSDLERIYQELLQGVFHALKYEPDFTSYTFTC